MLSQIIACYLERDPHSKSRRVRAFRTADRGSFETFAAELDTARNVPDVVDVGIPSRPALVEPKRLPRRALSSRPGHAAFIHAICHIEFTAINLALDAVIRFTGLPTAYYRDWLMVACDEAEHFNMLADHLETIGYRYGDFPAHAGLWDVAVRTAHDLQRRMALVPRVLEARGLDVTPPMIERLRAHGDVRGAQILEMIYRDEIRHVEAGSRWFNFAAAHASAEPAMKFRDFVAEEFGSIRNNKLNLAARRAAGFSETELAELAGD